MKLFISFLLFIQFNICGNNINKISNCEEPCEIFYNIALKRITKNDINIKKIIVKLDKNYSLNAKLEDVIRNIGTLSEVEKNSLLNKKIIYTKCENLNLTDILSNKSNSKKINNNSQLVLKYKFSLPYFLDTTTVVLFNSVYYLTPTEAIKGGSERLIWFKKTKNGWEISKITTLIEY